MTTTKSLKGTQTEKNIAISYMDESQSFARYMYYAQAADKEGLQPVGVIMRATAQNEMHHAKVFLKMLENSEVETPISIDAGFLGKTVDNLRMAMKEESINGYEFYNACAKTALEEGFPEIASHFTAIGKVEKFHHDRFARFLGMIENGTLWKREQPVEWVCLVCGYHYKSTTPPTKCPACDHPYNHYVCTSDEYLPYETF